jgi:hypothetical protein
MSEGLGSSAPEGFLLLGTRAFYRPQGLVTFAVAVDLVESAIDFAREHAIPELVINTTGLTGYPTPNTLERYDMALRWVKAARGGIRTVMVARPEIVDPDKIGVLIAANRGLVANVFTNEADAEHWLDTLGRAAR